MMTASENAAPMPSRFVSFADQGMYLGHRAGAQQVIQLMWRYRRPVDLAGLTRFRDNIAHGRMAHLIRPALLPFGRHQWAKAPAPSSAFEIPATPLPSTEIQAWADAQVELPLDPAHGPGWTFTAQPFSDGSTVISLVVSHCLADGMATALAVGEAARGERIIPYISPAQTTAATLAAELLRFVQDTPATLRALGQLMRTTRISRAILKTPVATKEMDERTASLPSVFVRVPTSIWDEKARSLGANRLTLVTAMAAAFAEALGRVRGNDVTLLIPVNQRDELTDTGGNRVSLATVKVSSNERHGRLHTFQRRLQVTLLRTRREPNPLATLLPLTPFVPQRAFSAASHMALDALADLPVTCSYVGEWPEDVLRVDGTPADGFCFRGTDRQASLRSIEARLGLASLPACIIPGYVILNFVAYQPGLVTEVAHLRPMVEKLLANYGLAGEFFDD
jgi:diacylglycerol O-acyltransferase